MGPPDRRTDHSSESDEESSTRHDKFKLERFQEKNVDNVKDDHSKYDNKYSRKYRERSPKKTSRHRDIVSSTYHTNESKTRHDHRDSSKRSYSGSSRSVDSEPLVKAKKCADINNIEKFEPPKPRKNNLSSLLKNFDKKVESKRNNSENSIEIGPVLPPHLRQNQIETEPLSSNLIDTSIGPALPPQLKNINEIPNNESNRINNSFKSKAVSSLVLDSEVSNISDTVTTVVEKGNEVHTAQSNLDDSCNTDNLIKGDYVKSSEQDLFGPALPPESKPETYGPTLPPKLDSDSYGPALPPSHVRDAIQGPGLPPEMASELGETAQEDSEDDDMVGPQVEGKMTKAQYLLDMRALHIKRKLDEEKGGISKEVKKREEWMLELPPEKASNLGLGPRSFRMKEAPDMSNRSIWTDTPADKLRKEQQALKGEAEPVSSEDTTRMAFIKERDNVMDKMLQQTKEKEKPESLLELHQKKLKKKKKKEEKEGKKKERRPFDRNIDLQVNRFDDAQKKAIFKKAQLLNTRFSSGESKYL